MSLDPGGGHSGTSPPSSGRSSPGPRVLRRTAADDPAKADKNLRRYAVSLERTLASWEVSPQEWADYIAFLGRLLKAIQAHPPDVRVLPHNADVALKLAQCLDPALPSGVHQKALEVYQSIFSIFGNDYVSTHLHHFLPGLCNVLAFASLSVRPLFYNLYEDHILQLPTHELRPALKSLILSLLPGLEEETGEDFDRAFSILEVLEKPSSATTTNDSVSLEERGYFWQCLFLAVITSPTRRQGALNYLTRKLPRLGSSQKVPGLNGGGPTTNGDDVAMSSNAEAVISPEPGLLIRCFVCGLSDPQILIQRGFLDLLVSHLPLDSPVIQRKAGEADLDRLVSAAAHVLLRRDMSLNRRLWTWLLGSASGDSDQDNPPDSPTDNRKAFGDIQAAQHLRYFETNGKESMERSVLKMFKATSSRPSEKARPFRICLSLMDRGEIGGTLVPSILLHAIQSVYTYSQGAPADHVSEVLRSASLFFDGIEADLIWTNLLGLLRRTSDLQHATLERLRLFSWVIQHFNMNDEEMLTVHIPSAALYLLCLLLESSDDHRDAATDSFLLYTVLLLVNMIPQRAFPSATHQQKVAASSVDDIRSRIEAFYETSVSRTSRGHEDASEFRRTALLDFEYLLGLLFVKFYGTASSDLLGQIVTLLTTFSNKSPELEILDWGNIQMTILNTFESAAASTELLPFTTLSSTVSLACSLAAHTNIDVKKTMIALEPSLISQLWRYLSPTAPKYHVEAVRLVWQLEDLTGCSEDVESSLTGLLRGTRGDKTMSHVCLAEAAKCFGVLWTHTIPAPSSSAKPILSTLTRRGSAMSTTSDPKQLKRREQIMTQSLMLVIDMLNEPDELPFEFAKGWLQTLPSLERVLRIHFERLAAATTQSKGALGESQSIGKRRQLENSRDLEYLLRHLSNIVRHGNDTTLYCLEEMSVELSNLDSKTGLLALAEICSRILCSDTPPSLSLSRIAIELLDYLLSGSFAAAIRPLGLEISILEQLTFWLARETAPLQGALLKLLVQTLRVRVGHGPTYTPSHTRRRSSITVKRPSSAGIRPSTSTSITAVVATPPPQLLNCLRLGFSAKSSRPYLDQWLEFLTNILPLFDDAIFTNLIPLVECLCSELNKAQIQLVAISASDGNVFEGSPESDSVALLEGLEIVLARAHDCLVFENPTEPGPKPSSSNQNLLSSVASGVFKSEATPSRNAQANSRLTVILAFQDAIRVALKIWIWASHSSDTDGFDKNSAATTSFNALRLRNRTRHLLEQMFNVEILESLEVIIARWSYTKDTTTAAAAIDLLHVMQGSRPKNVVPALIDSLCTRTNASALPSHRHSSQTIDLAPLDIAHFFSAYIESIEDDAMDEIWSDCLGFWREVLANPLPHRQVLPALLSIILLVAQKVENTTFGDQRKMRRDLGDIFQRLLAATFTAIPSGFIVDPTGTSGRNTQDPENNSMRGSRNMALVPVLVRVAANVEVILETSERATTAINSISVNLIGPVFHAKSFPKNITQELLELLLQMAKKVPTTRSWRKDISDAFNDPRFIATSSTIMQSHWFPLLRQWTIHDKERMPEMLMRLAPPSTAGIMFGVGANAARMDADRKTQLNLRRICLLLLSAPEDTFAGHMRTLQEKVVELFEASPSSSPSAAIKAELFMLCRAVILTTSAVQLGSIWPIINQALQSAFVSLLSPVTNSTSFSNLALLQGCKLLDLLVAVSPDEFQPHEWLYITDTIDAVYKPSDWNPSALADQVADVLAVESADDSNLAGPTTPFNTITSGHRRPLIADDMATDKEDWKAMAREDFARSVLLPFFSQLSIHSYEGVYSLDVPDVEACRQNLLDDILDQSTIVE